MLYSKETGGFYDPQIHTNNIPLDAVTISSEHHADLLNKQAYGSQIVNDNDGFPVSKSESINEIRAAKINQIDAAYNAAIQQDISYMGTTFQADEDSQSTLTKTLVTLNGAGSAPADWAWKDANNNMVPMTLAETNGLAMAMLARGWPEFQLRDARKKAVAAATTDAAVAAVTW